jgi:hypothetical protein
VHEAGDERQKDAERTKEAARHQQPHGISPFTQTSRKTTAQNILKNQKFILKYKNLDAQLQNTMFEYLPSDIGCSRWPRWSKCQT